MKAAGLHRVVGIGAFAAALAFAMPAVSDPLEDAQALLSAGDAAAAITLLEPLAVDGNAEAQFAVAELYRKGVGVPQDFGAAARMYELAASVGHAAAGNALGKLYAEGLGVKRDNDRALLYLEKAAANGSPEYQHDLGVFLDAGLGENSDKARAAQWYTRAADQKYAPAEANLGLLYYNGSGVEQSFSKALELFSKAAQAGNAKAQNNLGLMYVKGEGVERDYKKAAGLFAGAADQGLAQAMTNLGVMYDNGFGVPQNDAKAIELYRQAGRQGERTETTLLESNDLFFDPRLAALNENAAIAEFATGAGSGDPVAMFLTGYVQATAQPHRDLRSAARWFVKASEAGYPPAMANLGLLYFRGQGVPQDQVLSYVWLNRAAAAGFSDAAPIRDIIAGHMNPAQVNEAQALARK